MAVYTTASHTWAVGETVTAANMNAQIRDLINGFGVFSTYVPVVAGFTTVTTTVSGRYLQIQKLVAFEVQVQLSAVTTLGSSTITVTLPVAATASLPTQNQSGTAQFRTNAGVFTGGVITIGASGTTFTVLIAVPAAANPNLSRWTGAAPAGQVVGDIWSFSGTYEAA